MPPDQVIDEPVRDAEGGIMASTSSRFFGWVSGGTVPVAVAEDGNHDRTTDEVIRRIQAKGVARLGGASWRGMRDARVSLQLAHHRGRRSGRPSPDTPVPVSMKRRHYVGNHRPNELREQGPHRCHGARKLSRFSFRPDAHPCIT